MKKILALVLAITTLFALAIPAMAGKDPASPVNNFPFDGNNANFHCNDIEGENGRVWPDVGDSKSANGNNKSKTTLVFNVTRVGTSTTWTLDETVKCPSCESTKWVTFSNNSGTPNGNNVQFQHPAPSRRWITVKVTYHLDIPACPEFTCKNDRVCKYNNACEGCEPCDYERTPHDCTWSCNAGHDCPIKGATCSYDCEHAKSESKVIVNEKHLIKIADGYQFDHKAPVRWNGGKHDASQGPRVISELLFKSKAYDVYYQGKGDCKCRCKLVKCPAKACTGCNWAPEPPSPGHVHTPICDNCQNGQGNNHSNCQTLNPENNTNYFCTGCTAKLGSWNENQGWRLTSEGLKLGVATLECSCK